MTTGSTASAHALEYDRAVPAFLDPFGLARAVSGTRWGPVQVVASTGSTNADVARAARAGAAPGLVWVSAHQSAGRGRFERAWTAPPDTAVAISALVAPRRPARDWGWLSLLVGMAVVDALREVGGLPAALKWPNDVLVGERKICGILSERVDTPAGGLAVLGIGINVALREADLPVPTATSVLLEGGASDATALAAATLAALDRWYAHWEAGGPVAPGYAGRSATIGTEVAVHVGGGVAVRGRAVGVDEDGCLQVDVDGRLRTFAAGDVVHLRAQAAPDA